MRKTVMQKLISSSWDNLGGKMSLGGGVCRLVYDLCEKCPFGHQKESSSGYCPVAINSVREGKP